MPSPFLNKLEVAALREKAKELWEQADAADNLFEELRLRGKAHPYHPCTPVGVSFRLAPTFCGEYIFLQDTWGMLTVVDKHNGPLIIDWLFEEVKNTGHIREMITGENPMRDLEKKAEARAAQFTAEEQTMMDITLDDLLS